MPLGTQLIGTIGYQPTDLLNMYPVGYGRLRVIRDSKLRDLQMLLKGHRRSEVMMPLDQVPTGEHYC